MVKLSTAENTSKQFLELISKGQKAWDEWYEEAELQPTLVILSEINLNEFKIKISFKNFKFKEGSYFENVIFGENISFENAEFNGDFFLKSVIFEGSGDFINAKFNKVTFTNISFKSLNFKNAIFSNETTFQEISYHYSNNSSESENDPKINFNNARFHQNTIFKKSRFYSIDFSNTVFFNRVIFENSDFFNKSNFQNAIFGEGSEFKWCIVEECNFNIQNNYISKIKKEFNGQKNKSQKINTLPKFISVRFKEKFSCSLRLKETCYRSSVFEFVPDFGNNTEMSNTDITHIIIEPFTKIKNRFERLKLADSNIIKDLRRLRMQAAQIGASELETQLFLEELKCEQYLSMGNVMIPFSKIKNQGPYVIIKLMFSFFLRLLYLSVDKIYYHISNYGRSLVRPLAFIFLSFFVFRFIYLCIFSKLWLNSLKKQEELGASKIVSLDDYNHAFDIITLSNHIPIVGNLSIESNTKNILFCGYVPASNDLCLPPLIYDVTLIFQNIFVGLLIFLFGLAIRNYFKIK